MDGAGDKPTCHHSKKNLTALNSAPFKFLFMNFLGTFEIMFTQNISKCMSYDQQVQSKPAGSKVKS